MKHCECGKTLPSPPYTGLFLLCCGLLERGWGGGGGGGGACLLRTLEMGFFLRGLGQR